MLARGLCLLVLALPTVLGDSSVLPSPDPDTYPDFGSSVVFCVGDGALLAAATDSTTGAKAYHACAYNTATWEPKQVITLPVGFQPHAATCSAGGSTVVISGLNAASNGEVHVFTTTDLDTPYVQNATLTDDALGDLLHDTIGIPEDGAYLLIGRDLTGEKRVVTYEPQNSTWAAVNVLDLPGNPQQSPLLALSSDGLTGVFLTAGTAVAHQWVGQQWTVLQTVATPATSVSARLTSNGQFLAVARPEVGCEIHQFNSGTGQYELSYTATWPNLEAVIGITDAAAAVVTVTDTHWVVWNYQSPQWVVVQTVPLFTQQTVATHGHVPFVGAPCDSNNSGGECEESAVVLYDLTLCWGYGTCFSGRGQCVTSASPEPTARCNCTIGPGRFGGPFCERCATGFDNARNCLDCLTTRYGANCSEEISCDTEHGECPEGECWGLTGHGLCSKCDKLYYGTACDGEVLCIAENGVCEENECWGVNGTGLCSSCNGGMHALPRCSYKSWLLSVFIFGGLGVLTIAFGAYHVNRYRARSAMTLLP